VLAVRHVNVGQVAFTNSGFNCMQTQSISWTSHCHESTVNRWWIFAVQCPCFLAL